MQSSAGTARYLSGKSALITGSNAGLGYAIAQGLARAGCNIVLHGLAPEGEAAAQRDRLHEAHGVQASYVRCDLAHEEGVVRLAQHAQAAAGTIDILINNAVVRHFCAIEAFPMKEWERALAVNVSAAFRLVQLTLGGMRGRGWGRIINMTSVYASRGTVNRIDYVTTKSALLGFTRAIAMETIADGITCNAVCPGSVLTPGIDKRVQELMEESGLQREEAERRFLAGKQPTGRFVRSEDVAALIAFLCSPAARDITGAALPVEGGWLAS